MVCDLVSGSFPEEILREYSEYDEVYPPYVEMRRNGFGVKNVHPEAAEYLRWMNAAGRPVTLREASEATAPDTARLLVKRGLLVVLWVGESPGVRMHRYGGSSSYWLCLPWDYWWMRKAIELDPGVLRECSGAVVSAEECGQLTPAQIGRLRRGALAGVHTENQERMLRKLSSQKIARDWHWWREYLCGVSEPEDE